MESKQDFHLFLRDIKKIWFIFKRRWRLSAVIFLLVFGAIATKTFLAGPSYIAKGRLLLEKTSATSSLTESGREIGELRAIGSNDPVANEVEIIRSLPLIQRVIEALDLRDEEGERLEPEGVIQNKLSVDKVRGTDILQITYQSKFPEESAKVVNTVMNFYLKDAIYTNRQKAMQTSDFIRKQLPESQEMLRRTEQALRNFKEENLITDIAEERKLAATALDAINRKISDNKVEIERSRSRTHAIETRLQLSEQEAIQISALSQSPGIQNVLEDLQAAEQQLAIARDNFQPAHPNFVDIQSRVLQLRSLLQERIAASSDPAQSFSAIELQSRGLELDLIKEYVQLSISNTELFNQLGALQREKAPHEARIAQFPRIEQGQRELERKLNASQTTYEILLKKLGEISIAAKQSEGNGRIIEYANPPNKIELKPIAIKLFLGILLGSLMAVGLAILIELRDKSIKTVDEAEEILGYPLLGIIPNLKDVLPEQSFLRESEDMTSCLIVNKFPSSSYSEAFRMLHSNLKFLQSDTPLKTIAITSSVKNEGKSTISANLAIAIAQQGKKVLLMDADLRCPVQQTVWRSFQFKGLSDLIVGEAQEHEVIHPVMDGLSLLTAGAIPPHPSALIDSQRMKSLIKKLEKIYDYVIIDTPPLLVASETRLFGDLVDGVVIVVRPNVAESENLFAVRKILHQLEPKVLGIVANAVEPRNENSSYFYYDKTYFHNSPIPSTSEKVGRETEPSIHPAFK